VNKDPWNFGYDKVVQLNDCPENTVKRERNVRRAIAASLFFGALFWLLVILAVKHC